MTPQQRIENLLQYLQQDIYEKETETALALLAALAGESILLLGPPGVAKSMPKKSDGGKTLTIKLCKMLKRN